MYYFHYNLPPGGLADTLTNATKTWNPAYQGLTNEPVLDATGAATSLTLTMPATVNIYDNAFFDNVPTWTGDASWDDEVADDMIRFDTTWSGAGTVDGLDSSKTYIVEINAPTTQVGRTIEFRVNGGTGISKVQSQDPDQETFKFTVSGVTQVAIEARQVSGGFVYAKSFRIYEDVPVPAITVSGSLEPGAALSGTFENFAGTPTTLTITDSEGNSISSGTEITDLVVSPAGTFTFTMPALPSSGSSQGLLFGDVTLELS